MSNLKEIREAVSRPMSSSDSISHLYTDRRQLVGWLDEALKYVGHKSSCEIYRGHGFKCTCGHNEFLARLGAP